MLALTCRMDIVCQKKYFKGQEKKGICPSKHIAKIIQPEIIVPAINMET